MSFGLGVDEHPQTGTKRPSMTLLHVWVHAGSTSTVDAPRYPRDTKMWIETTSTACRSTWVENGSKSTFMFENLGSTIAEFTVMAEVPSR